MIEPNSALGRALASYADVTSGDALDAHWVRSRVLRSVSAPKRSRLRRYALVLPLVAAFAASAALAANHGPVRAVVAAWMQSCLDAAKPSTSRPSARGSKLVLAPSSATGASSSTAPEAPPEPIAVDELPLAGPPSAAERAPGGAGRALAVPARKMLGPIDAQLNAYQAAHRTHFDASAPAVALAAWDGYLASFPAGSFALDARFNRALCLIRLGRRAEARAALISFAAASPGSYRQLEATALLRGLSQSEPASATAP